MTRSLLALLAAALALAPALRADHLEITKEGHIGYRSPELHFNAEFNLVEVVEGQWNGQSAPAGIHPQQGPEVKLETESRFQSGASVAWQRSGRVQGKGAVFSETWQTDPIRGFAEIKIVQPVEKFANATAEITGGGSKKVLIAELLEAKKEWENANGTSMTIKGWDGATATFHTEETATFWVMAEYDQSGEPQNVVFRIHSGEPADLGNGEFRWSVETSSE